MNNLQVTFLAPEGRRVDSGTVLARFDPSSAMKRIADKETELQTTLSDMQKLRAQQSADEEQAKADFENAKLSLEQAKLSAEQMKFEATAKQRDAELTLKKAELSYRQAEKNLKNKGIVRRSELSNLQLKIKQINDDIAQARHDMDQLTLHAPISGLVVYEQNWSSGRKIAVGDNPWPGMSLISLPDLASMQVEVSVNEMDISKAKAGQRVEIRPDAFPDSVFSGAVKSVAQVGHDKSFGTNVKVFEVIVDVSGTSDILKPGMTTQCRIIVDRIDSVLSVPIDAVFEKDGKTIVYAMSGSRAQPRDVTLGAKNDNFVVVTAGISAGERVALRDPTEDASAPAKKDSKPSGPARPQ
jgi:RND family efflux transporter MFP subunit